MKNYFEQIETYAKKQDSQNKEVYKALDLFSKALKLKWFVLFSEQSPVVFKYVVYISESEENPEDLRGKLFAIDDPDYLSYEEDWSGIDFKRRNLKQWMYPKIADSMKRITDNRLRDIRNQDESFNTIMDIKNILAERN